MKLQAHKERYDNPEFKEATGIFVRGYDPNGVICNLDIAELTQESLVQFLKSRGGDNKWAENIVLLLLGHEQIKS